MKSTATEQSIRALVLAPSKELCHQIHGNLSDLSIYCTRDIKVINIASQGDPNAIRSILAEKPDVVVATPTKMLSHLQAKSLDLKESLEILVVDEADLIFSFGYESDLRQLVGYLPTVYQAVLASATLSDDVLTLKKLVLHSPVVLKLQEPMIPPVSQLTHYVVRVENIFFSQVIDIVLEMYNFNDFFGL